MNQTHQFYTQLKPQCCFNLKQALNPNTAIYDRQIRNQQWEETWGTEDLTSTCICLIGINRAEIELSEVGLNPTQTLEALFKLAKRRQYLGGLGLVIWANAVWDGIPLKELQRHLSISFDDNLVNHITSITSMEVAWLASGLLHDYQRTPNEKTKKYINTAVEALLERYRSDTRLMVHASARAPMNHRLRRWVANFADQIYSVQALSFAAIVTGNTLAKQAAENLARQLIEFQGNYGQWWWHYDPRNGHVTQPYSVYSVHQHGMVPMALAALIVAGGPRFTEYADRGRAWLNCNELNISMIDHDAKTIWRSIDYDQDRLRDLSHKMRSLLGWRAHETSVNSRKLKINFETRPYEWGWCLYAGAIETDINKKLHIV